jgi:hypothetical protein
VALAHLTPYESPTGFDRQRAGSGQAGARGRLARKGRAASPGVVVVPAFEIGLVQSSQPKMLGAARRKELTRSWST